MRGGPTQVPHMPLCLSPGKQHLMRPSSLLTRSLGTSWAGVRTVVCCQPALGAPRTGILVAPSGGGHHFQDYTGVPLTLLARPTREQGDQDTERGAACPVPELLRGRAGALCRSPLAGSPACPPEMERPQMARGRTPQPCLLPALASPVPSFSSRQLPSSQRLPPLPCSHPHSHHGGEGALSPTSPSHQPEPYNPDGAAGCCPQSQLPHHTPNLMMTVREPPPGQARDGEEVAPPGAQWTSPCSPHAPLRCGTNREGTLTLPICLALTPFKNVVHTAWEPPQVT